MGNIQTRLLNHNRVEVKLLVQDDDYVKVWVTENDIKTSHDVMSEYRELDVNRPYLKERSQFTANES